MRKQKANLPDKRTATHPPITLVSLISDQSIPNVLVIKETKNVTHYLFITTKQMEKKEKIDDILRAANIKNSQIQRVVVDENALDNISTELKQLNLSPETLYLVNLTGGTKLMAIGAYNFFINFPEHRRQFLYIAIGSNKIYDLLTKKETLIEARLSIQEYLDAYKIRILNENSINQLLFPENKTIDIGKKLLSVSVEKRKLLSPLKKFRNKNHYDIKTEDNPLREFLNEIGIPYHNNQLSRRSIRFLTGEWLEDFFYCILKTALMVRPENINKGVQIDHSVQNELDVILTYGNKIFLFECKSALDSPDNESSDKSHKNLLAETAYKSAALQQQFGLQVKSFIVLGISANEFPNFIEIEKRATAFKIKIIDKDIINNKVSFQKFVDNTIAKISY